MRPHHDDLMFKAFADRRRLRILHLLRDGEMCVGDIVTILGLPQSTVSRQLGLLRRSGLVDFREDGLWRHYRLTEPSSSLHAHLVDCLGRCFEHVPALRRDAERAAAVRASGGCCTDRPQASADTGSPGRSAARSRAASPCGKKRVRK